MERPRTPKARGGQDGQFRAGVVAVDVGARISLRVAEILRFPQNALERSSGSFDFRENVVRGAVEDADQRVDSVPRDTLAQGCQDRDSACHGCFQPHPGTAFQSPGEDGGTVFRHQFLVGGDHWLAGVYSGFDDFSRDSCAADKLRHEVDGPGCQRDPSSWRSGRLRDGG